MGTIKCSSLCFCECGNLPGKFAFFTGLLTQPCSFTMKFMFKCNLAETESHMIKIHSFASSLYLPLILFWLN